ncbi:MAG: hypothetical protein CMP22_04235 [Rickettsiales bacterium]|nr:hypothetical protein [Rickettsiales bacterium]|tara:strand:+ start:36 stop:305 length:270 start_codon:yes stop_codon:yes gene_type:complete
MVDTSKKADVPDRVSWELIMSVFPDGGCFPPLNEFRVEAVNYAAGKERLVCSVEGFKKERCVRTGDIPSGLQPGDKVAITSKGQLLKMI